MLLSDFPEAMSIAGLWDATGLFANAELAGTVEDRFNAVDFDFAAIFFLLSVPASSSPSFWELIKLEILAQQVKLKWLMLKR